MYYKVDEGLVKAARISWIRVQKDLFMWCSLVEAYV